MVAHVASAQEGASILPEPDTKRIAADVGTGQVSMDRILEIWGPSWYDTIHQTVAGRMTPTECDEKLNKEWTQALESVIREEVFYQEAEREFDMMISKRAREACAAQTNRNVNYINTDNAIYRRIERELRDRFQKSVDRSLNDHIERYIQAAGGMGQLKKVIAARGISWTAWKERIRRKAFADMYLRMRLVPDFGSMRDAYQPGPAEIREYYKQHPKEFIEPGAVVFRHILFSFEKRGGENAARLAAQNVYDALLDKRFTFEEAARKFSDDDESKAQGGLEKEISADPVRETWLIDIREALRTETPGEIGSLLISPAGCHLVMLKRAEPGKPTPFRKAQKTISRKLYSRRWEAKVQELYEELRRQIRVVIHTKTYPSSYQWDTVRGGEGRLLRERRIGPASVPEVKAEKKKTEPVVPAVPETPPAP